MMRSDLEVFILAGGKSRRMGSEKGLVNFHGEPMIARILKVLEELDLPVRIISSNSDYLEFGTPVYQDLIPDKGPLGGLYTALEISSAPKIILLACDMPSINIEALHKIIEMSNSEELIVATDGKTISPFFACYPNFIKADVKRAILSCFGLIYLCSTVPAAASVSEASGTAALAAKANCAPLTRPVSVEMSSIA